MRYELDLKTGERKELPDDPPLPPKTQEEIDAELDAKVEGELGTDTVRIIMETIVPMIQDGTISTTTPADVIAQCKANRRAEL